MIYTYILRCAVLWYISVELENPFVFKIKKNPVDLKFYYHHPTAPQELMWSTYKLRIFWLCRLRCVVVSLLWGSLNTLGPKTVQLGIRPTPIREEGPTAKQGVCGLLANHWSPLFGPWTLLEGVRGHQIGRLAPIGVDLMPNCTVFGPRVFSGPNSRETATHLNLQSQKICSL